MNTQIKKELMQDIRGHADHCFNGDYHMLREYEEIQGQETTTTEKV